MYFINIIILHNIRWSYQIGTGRNVKSVVLIMGLLYRVYYECWETTCDTAINPLTKVQNLILRIKNIRTLAGSKYTPLNLQVFYTFSV